MTTDKHRGQSSCPVQNTNI